MPYGMRFFCILKENITCRLDNDFSLYLALTPCVHSTGQCLPLPGGKDSVLCSEVSVYPSPQTYRFRKFTGDMPVCLHVYSALPYVLSCIPCTPVPSVYSLSQAISSILYFSRKVYMPSPLLCLHCVFICTVSCSHYALYLCISTARLLDILHYEWRRFYAVALTYADGLLACMAFYDRDNVPLLNGNAFTCNGWRRRAITTGGLCPAFLSLPLCVLPSGSGV